MAFRDGTIVTIATPCPQNHDHSVAEPTRVEDEDSAEAIEVLAQPMALDNHQASQGDIDNTRTVYENES